MDGPKRRKVDGPNDEKWAVQKPKVDDPKSQKVNGLKELNVDGPMIETARI